VPDLIGHVVPYLLAGSIGVAVGAGELVSRYRDDPRAVLLSAPAVLYLLINMLASMLGYYFVASYPVLPAAATELTKLLMAGFGAMAVFRASLFTTRIGSSDVAIGPNAFLQIIMAAVDRAIDRNRACNRARIVTTIMAGVSFEKARTVLPVFCFSLMQNVDQADQEKAGTGIKMLANDTTLDDQMKAYSLGLILLNIVGEDVLHEAVARSKDKLSP